MSFHVEFHPPGLLSVGQAEQLIFQIYFSWVKMSFHVEFHLPGIIPSGRKVCVVGGGGGWFEGKFSVSFGPNLRFRLWIWTWTKLNNCGLWIMVQ